MNVTLMMDRNNSGRDTHVPSWQEIIKIFRDEGLNGIWTRAMSRTLYRRLILVERMLDQPDFTLETDVSLTFSLLQPHQIQEYCILRKEADPEIIKDRLQAKLFCFVAECEKRMVAVCWATLSKAPIDYLEMELPLAASDVYLFDSFTSPEFRGRNVAGTRGLYMIRYFRNAGYKRLVAAVLPENKPAVRPILKLGYRPFAIVTRWKLGPWRHTSCRSCTTPFR